MFERDRTLLMLRHAKANDGRDPLNTKQTSLHRGTQTRAWTVASIASLLLVVTIGALTAEEAAARPSVTCSQPQIGVGAQRLDCVVRECESVLEIGVCAEEVRV
jgi:hypothetical protein